MKIEIVTGNLKLDIYGFRGIAVKKDYAGTAFRLSGKMWEVIRLNNIKNKGKNIWVYDVAEKVFAGVELENDITINNNYGLEKYTIDIKKYAYLKYTGAYNKIKQTGEYMTKELTRQGFEITLPYIEIYGHWTSDETKLETELLMCLQ
ncbi:MAG TPA: GyrI-like domain-containing protein [Parafilimonas sp.]|nr:GyrI-like domain-containing protein [Parafilimonas sp.]